MSSIEKNPAIVVSAYNREHSLLRLLNSLEQAEYRGTPATLVISIDKSDNIKVAEVAETFHWPHGEKRIIRHQKQLGLRQHILSCGDLTAEYGSIILFEDDLFASKYFYSFAASALKFYHDDRRVAGISLYSYDISENGFNPFVPVDDGNDVYFMQVASSWGQAWTQEQWQAFRAWYQQNSEMSGQEQPPVYLLQWSAESWKKHYIRYLHFTDKYFVFPHHSYSTNFEDAGTTAKTKGLYQVPLLQANRKVNLIPLDQSRSVYDAYFEMTPACLKKWNTELNSYDFSTDIYGDHPIGYGNTPYVLTSKPANNAVLSFGIEMFPPVLNVINRVQGDAIKLVKRADVLQDKVPSDQNYYKYTTVSEIIFQRQLIDRIEDVHKTYDAKIKGLHSDYAGKLEELNHEIRKVHEDYHAQMRTLHEQHAVNLKETVANALKEYQFNLDYPAFSLVTIAKPEDLEAALETARSVQQQDYPRFFHRLILIGNNKEVDVSGFAEKSFSLHNVNNVAEAIELAEAHYNGEQSDYHCWLEAGTTLLPKAMQTVREIFRRFNEVNWLKGLPVKGGAEKEIIPDSYGIDFRWDKQRFQESTLAELGNKISRAGIFWKKHLWQRAGSKLNKTHLHLADIELFDRLYKTDTLYVAMSYLARPGSVSYIPSADAEKEFESLRKTFSQKGSTLRTLSYPFFTRDIPYLRAIHKSRSSYPPLIRFDYNSQSFYLSEY